MKGFGRTGNEAYEKHKDYVNEHNRHKRSIERRKCKHPKERARFEKDTAAWLRHYLPGAYPLPWGKVHLDIIEGAESALETGGKFVVAAPRGTGKSTVLWGVALKFVLQGKLKFPALLPWKASELRKALRFWKNALCFNAKLLADYPEYCQPFAESRGSSQKCMTLCWSDTEQPAGAELRISDGMMVFPDGLGAIGSSTINGNPRGLNHATEDGRVLRPDLVFIDDPQDKSVAKSPSQVLSIIDVIDTDVMGMAGPNERMPVLLSCTVMQPGDVATHYLDAKDWRAVKVGQIVTWPDNRELWQPFGDLIKDKREPEALKYYIEHKAELTKGMTVSWDSRFDKKRKEPDALYSAMRDFYFMGEKAFMAERQNEPQTTSSSLYDLTPAIICTHVAPLPRLHVPAAANFLVGMIDINPRAGGLHWAVAAFDQTMTGHCPAYGKWPERGNMVEKNASEQTIQVAIYRGLTELCGLIQPTVFIRDNLQIRPSLILVDVGYMGDAVQRFVQQARYSFRVVPSIGRDSKRYRVKNDTLVGRPFENCHVQRAEKVGHGPYVMFHADYWRETMQRAFLGVAGERGGFTLYQPNHAGEHSAFAEQVCAEKLAHKGDIGGGLRWEWTHQPGASWDWGDALTGCWVAAATCGLSASGQPVVAAQSKKARVVIRRPSR